MLNANCLEVNEHGDVIKFEILKSLSLPNRRLNDTLIEVNYARIINERKTLFKLRSNPKLFDMTFTNAVKEYLDTTGRVTNYAKLRWYVYQVVGCLGAYKLWKLEQGKKQPFRKTLEPEILEMILEVENLAGKIIKNKAYDPCTALRLAAECLGHASD